MMGEGSADSRAGVNCVAEDVCLVNIEVQDHSTVATVLVRHDELILARFVERIGFRLCYTILLPIMLPFEWQLTVGNGLLERFCDHAVTNLETQLDDAVTMVSGAECVYINACLVQIALDRYILLRLIGMLVELDRVTVAERVADDTEVLLSVIHIQVVDAIEAINSGRQRIYYVERAVLRRQREDFREAVVPGVLDLLARELTYLERITIVICRVNEQVQRVDRFTMLT